MSESLLHRRMMMLQQGGGFEILPYFQSSSFAEFAIETSYVRDLSIYVLANAVPGSVSYLWFELKRGGNTILSSGSYGNLNLSYNGATSYNWSGLPRTNASGLYQMTNNTFKFFYNNGTQRANINMTAAMTAETIDSIRFRAPFFFEGENGGVIYRLFVMKGGDVIIDVRPVLDGGRYYYMDILSGEKVEILNDGVDVYADAFAPYQGTLPA